MSLLKSWLSARDTRLRWIRLRSLRAARVRQRSRRLVRRRHALCRDADAGAGGDCIRRADPRYFLTAPFAAGLGRGTRRRCSRAWARRRPRISSPTRSPRWRIASRAGSTWSSSCKRPGTWLAVGSRTSMRSMTLAPRSPPACGVSPTARWRRCCWRPRASRPCCLRSGRLRAAAGRRAPLWLVDRAGASRRRGGHGGGRGARSRFRAVARAACRRSLPREARPASGGGLDEWCGGAARCPNPTQRCSCTERSRLARRRRWSRQSRARCTRDTARLVPRWASVPAFTSSGVSAESSMR